MELDFRLQMIALVMAGVSGAGILVLLYMIVGLFWGNMAQTTRLATWDLLRFYLTYLAISIAFFASGLVIIYFSNPRRNR